MKRTQKDIGLHQEIPEYAPLVVIGGGMAGLCSAVTAARELKRTDGRGLSVLILDAGCEPGSKLLVTGNGRCNVTNLDQRPGCYRTEEPSAARRLGLGDAALAEEVIRFLRDELHVLCHDRHGYVYPRTDQAVTVQKALLARCRELGVQICSNVRVMDLHRAEDGQYRLELPTGKQVYADAVLLAAGGMVSAQYGCCGDGYRLAAKLGHQCIPPAPALCALRVQNPGLKRAAGVRTHGRVSVLLNQRELASSEGEIQLNRDTISGIPVFQVSRYAGRALTASCADQNGSCKAAGILAVLDFLPELAQTDWEQERKRRLQEIGTPEAGRQTLQDFCLGLLPDKAVAWLIEDQGGIPEQKLRAICDRVGVEGCRSFLSRLLDSMRRKILPVVGTADYDKAQATSGGIRLSEMSDSLESKLSGGFFAAGEVLDVDGMCGGYNLTFAVHSGRIAGKASAEYLRHKIAGAHSVQRSGEHVVKNPFDHNIPTSEDV